MKPYLSIFFVSLFFATSSYGKTAKAKKPQKPVKEAAAPVTEEQAPVAEDYSSAGIRQRKVAGVGILGTTVSDYALKYGAEGFYEAGADWQFGLAVLAGSESLDDGLKEDSTVTTSASFRGLAAYGMARYFVGNSFVVTSGLGYRSADVEYKIEAGSARLSGTLSIQSIVVPIFVGNHWTWGNGFTLGVDWIGVFVPVTGGSSTSTEGNIGSTVVDDANNDMADLGEELSKKPSLTIGLISLAWLF